MEIDFRSSDPVQATNAANSIVDEYLQHTLTARVQGTAQVSQWVLEQMQGIRANTTAAQEKLAAFQRDNNLLGADESDNIVTDRLKQLNEELTQAEADRIVKEGRLPAGHSSERGAHWIAGTDDDSTNASHAGGGPSRAVCSTQREVRQRLSKTSRTPGTISASGNLHQLGGSEHQEPFGE